MNRLIVIQSISARCVTGSYGSASSLTMSSVMKHFQKSVINSATNFSPPNRTRCYNAQSKVGLTFDSETFRPKSHKAITNKYTQHPFQHQYEQHNQPYSYQRRQTELPPQTVQTAKIQQNQLIAKLQNQLNQDHIAMFQNKTKADQRVDSLKEVEIPDL